MKITMSTTFRLLALTLAAITFATGQARATEVLVNGDFASGLAPWYVEDGIDPSWDPLDSSQGAASLHPLSTEGYMGPVLIQPVNVTDIAGQQATATVDLWVVNGDLTSDAPMVAMKIEFLDSSGQIHEETVLQSSLKEIGQSDAANPSHQQASPYTFPSDAVRLVEVSLVKLGYGEVMADNVSLDIANATVGPVPLITGISPTSVAYGDTVTITGTNFGTTQGQVLINGRPDGLTVQSWSDTQIVVKVDAPAIPGRLSVVSGTESPPSPQLEISSPFFYITSADIPDRMIVVRGQVLRLPLGIGFANGYTLPTGANISWTLVDPSGATPPTHSFTPTTLNGPGGTVLTVDTSSMTPGLHRFEVQASDGTTTQVGKGEVEIRTIGKVEFVDTTTMQPVTAFSVNYQGRIDEKIDLRFYDTNGNEFPNPDTIPITVTSSNSAVVSVYQNAWDVQIYSVGSGDATVNVAFPDGFTAQLPVTVTLPTTPHVDVTLTPTEVSNKGGSVSFEVTSTDPLTNVGWTGSWLFLQEDTQNCPGYGTDYTTYSCTYTVDMTNSVPNPAISSAVFYAAAGSGTATATGAAFLSITNDPEYAGMEGVRASIDPSLSPFELEHGTFEFYDPNDPATPLFTRPLEGQYGATVYSVGGILPGTYLVRYKPLTTTYPDLAQWYPNSTDAAGATPVTFTAGQVTKDINFLFFGQQQSSGGGLVIDQFTPDTVSGTAPLTVTFTCLAHSEAGNTVTGYDFDIDRDGTPEVTGDTDGIYQHTYSTTGTYDAVCTAHDDAGNSVESTPRTITVSSDTGSSGTNPWDCNGNGTIDLADIICQLRLLAAEQQSQP